MRPASPRYQTRGTTELLSSVSQERRCKNPQQNASELRQRRLKRTIHHARGSTLEKSVNGLHHVHRLNEKNHTILSLHAEKAFDKFQRQVMTKIFRNFRDFNLIKKTHKKPTANIILGEKLEAFTPRPRTAGGQTVVRPDREQR